MRRKKKERGKGGREGEKKTNLEILSIEREAGRGWEVLRVREERE